MTEHTPKSDAVLILGTTVFPSGNLSRRLKARVNKGIELYKKGKVNKIIVSGGLGKEGHFEGSAMKKYLISNNIPSRDIIVDDKGNNTHLTAINLKRIVEKNNIKSVIVVSQYFHLMRTNLAINQLCELHLGRAHANYYNWKDDWFSIGRECVGYYWYLVRY